MEPPADHTATDPCASWHILVPAEVPIQRKLPQRLSVSPQAVAGLDILIRDVGLCGIPTIRDTKAQIFDLIAPTRHEFSISAGIRIRGSGHQPVTDKVAAVGRTIQRPVGRLIELKRPAKLGAHKAFTVGIQSASHDRTQPSGLRIYFFGSIFRNDEDN